MCVCVCVCVCGGGGEGEGEGLTSDSKLGGLKHPFLRVILCNFQKRGPPPRACFSDQEFV